MFRSIGSNGSNISLATLSLRSQGSTSDIGRSSSTSLKRDTSRDGHDDSVDTRASIEYDDAPENQRLLSTKTDGTEVVGGEIDKWALACLLLQHVSNTFNTGLYEFASFLFREYPVMFYTSSQLAGADLRVVIEVYRDTLVPASLVGLFAKLTGLLLSGHIGGLVDSTPRLPFVRWALGVEKVLNACNYALFLSTSHTAPCG
jgi:iron-regulated transporter 1